MSKFLKYTGFVFSIMLLFFMLVPAIPQDLGYHDFADQRTFFGIPNFFDVVSNVMFLVPGMLGMFHTIQHWRDVRLFICSFERWIRLVSFFGMTLVCFGSAYYHVSPDNATLFWDRLPMSISFMAILSLAIAHYISLEYIKLLFFGLEGLGMGSVLYWSYTESVGKGDLRLYVLVQFVPLLAIPVMVFYNKGTRKVPREVRNVLFALGWYVLAKIAELGDKIFFAMSHGYLSGHTLKHIFAAIGCFYIYKWYTAIGSDISSKPVKQSMT